MKKNRFTEEQIVAVLRDAEATTQLTELHYASNGIFWINNNAEGLTNHVAKERGHSSSYPCLVR